jgi:hypothetical protein
LASLIKFQGFIGSRARARDRNKKARENKAGAGGLNGGNHAIAIV